MEQPEPPGPGPSILGYSLFGYLIASVVGVLIVAVMSMRAGDYDEPTAFAVLVCIGGFGALVGFETAARHRKAYGGGGMTEEWKKFWGSLRFYGLAASVLGGSSLITLRGSLIAMAVVASARP